MKIVIRCSLILLLTTSSSIGEAPLASGESECVGVKGKTFRIVAESRMNATGGWETRFDAQQELPDGSASANLDLKHAVVVCGGKQVLQISGVFGDSSKGTSPVGDLRFHEKCGTNVGVINGGRGVQKLNAEDSVNAVALTNRPLKTNELFEVRLENKIHSKGYFMGIGLTVISPYKDPIPSHLNALKHGTWMFYHTHLFNNGSLMVKTYPRSLDTVQVGDRIGVMRSEVGTLHLYHNGVDQGPAASNIPTGLFGGLELYGDWSQMSIVS